MTILILFIYVVGYEEINESEMDPPRAHSSNRVDTDCMEAPSLPRRLTIRQQMIMNRSPNIILDTSNFNDSAASDTESGYEHVANPMKKTNQSAAEELTDKQGQTQNEDHGNGKDYKPQLNVTNYSDLTKVAADSADCRKIGKSDSILFGKPTDTFHAFIDPKQIGTFPIYKDEQQIHGSTYISFHNEGSISSGDKENVGDTKGLDRGRDVQGCDQDPFKYRTFGVGLHGASDDNILYKRMSKPAIVCQYKGDENNYGYQKLIKETMEPTSRTHEYQKLNKLTMEPRLTITKPQCNKVNHHTF